MASLGLKAQASTTKGHAFSMVFADIEPAVQKLVVEESDVSAGAPTIFTVPVLIAASTVKDEWTLNDELEVQIFDLALQHSANVGRIGLAALLGRAPIYNKWNRVSTAPQNWPPSTPGTWLSLHQSNYGFDLISAGTSLGESGGYGGTPDEVGGTVSQAVVQQKLKAASTIEELTEIARDHLSREIADKLTKLRDQPYDVEAGDEPPKVNSVAWFLDYCLRRGTTKRPLMTVTPDGLLQGDWQKDKGHTLSMRFFEDGRVWIVLRHGSVRANVEHPVDKLLTRESVLAIPDWAQ